MTDAAPSMLTSRQAAVLFYLPTLECAGALIPAAADRAGSDLPAIHCDDGAVGASASDREGNWREVEP